MRILISALSRFASPTGICRHAANLCRALADRPEVEHITFVTGAWQGYYHDLLNGIASGKVENLPVDLRNNSISRNRWFVSSLFAVARSRHADIVHLSFPLPFRRNDIGRVAVSLHDLYPYDCPQVFGYPNVLFNRFFLRSCLDNVDGIASVSHVTQARLHALFSARIARKSRVIPNIVSLSGVTAEQPTHWTDQPFVLVVAQHRRNKNLGLAVQGFAELRKRGVIPPETRLVMVGSAGPDTESLRATIRRSGAERETRLISQVPESCLQWLYQNSLLLLITSTVEGFCLPLIEGLRSSSRLVCSDIPILREVGGNQCQYFSMATSPVDSLVAAAQRALSLPKPQAADLDRFSSQRAGAAYVNFYSDLLNAFPVSETIDDRQRIPSVISKS